MDKLYSFYVLHIIANKSMYSYLYYFLHHINLYELKQFILNNIIHNLKIRYFNF